MAIVQSSTGSFAPGSVISIVARMPRVGADNRQSMLVWRDRELINMLLGKIADQRPRATRLAGFDRGIDEKDCPSGRVEQVVRSAAEVVAAEKFADSSPRRSL